MSVSGVSVSSARARFEAAAACNLPPALAVKVVKASAEVTPYNVPYAFPDISAPTIRARALAAAESTFPLTWDPAYAPAVNASSNVLTSGLIDDQLRVSGCVGHGSNSVSISQYLQNYGAASTLLQTGNRYYLAGSEGGDSFFSVGASNDGRLTYGVSNAAFGASTGCVMKKQFGFGTCNVAFGVCNFSSVAPTLKSAWNLSNVTYYPQGAWNLKPPIVAAGGQSYTDSNFGLAVALSNYTSFPDTALSFSISSNTNAAVPFSTTGNFANVLTLSGAHAAVAAGSNKGTLTLSVINSLDTTGFAVACNVAVPYTVFALAPPVTYATPSSLKIGTTGDAYTLPSLAGYVAMQPGGAYTCSVLSGSNPYGNVSVNASTGVLTVARLTSNVSYTVGFRVTDQFSQSNTQSVEMTSVPPPTANGAPVAVVKSSSNVSLPTFGSAGFNLQNGGAYTYSLTTDQLSNAVVDAGTGALTVTGVSGCNAVYSVGVTAVDQFAQSSQRSITLTSVPPPAASGPIWFSGNSASNLSIPSTSNYFTRKSAGAYTYSMTSNPFSNASIDASTGTLSVVGSNNISISISSGVYNVGVRIADQVLQQADQSVIIETRAKILLVPTSYKGTVADSSSIASVSCPIAFTGVAGSQPTFKATGGGRDSNSSYYLFSAPATSSPAGGQYLKSGSLSLNLADNGGYTIVAYVKFLKSVAYGYAPIFMCQGGGIIAFMLNPDGCIMLSDSLGGVVLSDPGVPTVDTWDVYVARMNNSTMLKQIFKNGTEVGRGFMLGTVKNFTPYETRIARAFNEAGDPDLNMQLGGFILYDLPLSDSEVQRVTNYFQQVDQSPAVAVLALPSGSKILLEPKSFNATVANNSSIASVACPITFTGTAGSQPVFKTTGGGRGANLSYYMFTAPGNDAAFGGQFLQATSSGLTLNCATNGGLTVVMYLNFRSTVNYQFPRMFCFNGIGGYFEFILSNGQIMVADQQGGFLASGAVATTDTWDVYVARMINSTKVIELFKNGTQIASGTMPTTVLNKTPDTIRIARALGGDPDTNMDLGGLVVYDYALSNAEVTTATDYFLALANYL